jgi:NAD(P)-dependent dehydrogenase (short-subunit alcohol dehydrogenase family)
VKGRVALVTGATKNIGFAIAQELSIHGYAIALNGRDPVAVESACARLRSQGAEAVPVVADVSSEADVTAMVDLVLARWGRVDVLVNNAGLRAHGAITATALGDWQRVLATVLTGAFLTTRAVFGPMRDNGFGRIVNIGGISAQRGAAERAAVTAAKAGLVGLTKTTALEGAPHGITANVVSPGSIDTDRSAILGDPDGGRAYYRGAAERNPLRRLGHPAEVAAACAYLCGESAGFVTGQVIAINGGAYM